MRKDHELTIEDVREAILSLKEDGKKISTLNVRSVTGTGSYTKIGSLIRQIQSEEQAGSIKKIDKSNELFSAMQSEFRTLYDQSLNDYKMQVIELSEKLEETENKITALEKQMETMHADHTKEVQNYKDRYLNAIEDLANANKEVGKVSLLESRIRMYEQQEAEKKSTK